MDQWSDKYGVDRAVPSLWHNRTVGSEQAEGEELVTLTKSTKTLAVADICMQPRPAKDETRIDKNQFIQSWTESKSNILNDPVLILNTNRPYYYD